jgi:hypothetical protein
MTFRARQGVESTYPKHIEDRVSEILDVVVITGEKYKRIRKA